MSLLLMITFLLTLGYIKSMSIPIQLQQQFQSNLLSDNSDLIDKYTEDLKNNKILVKKFLEDVHNINGDDGGDNGSDSIDGTTMTIKKRYHNNNKNNWDIEKRLDYPKKYGDICDKKCCVDYKLYDDDYENLMDKYKLMQRLLTSLGPNHFEAFSNSGLNSSGRREGPLYAEEPKYVIIPKESDDEILDSLDLITSGSDGFRDLFIPPRGRKQMPILEKLKDHYELFVPNRGKKRTNMKKDKIKDIFKYNDLFFPNRGKKNNVLKKRETLKETKIF